MYVKRKLKRNGAKGNTNLYGLFLPSRQNEDAKKESPNGGRLFPTKKTL